MKLQHVSHACYPIVLITEYTLHSCNLCLACGIMLITEYTLHSMPMHSPVEYVLILYGRLMVVSHAVISFKGSSSHPLQPY